MKMVVIIFCIEVRKPEFVVCASVPFLIMSLLGSMDGEFDAFCVTQHFVFFFFEFCASR
jgi:hypothetical protein